MDHSRHRDGVRDRRLAGQTNASFRVPRGVSLQVRLRADALTLKRQQRRGWLGGLAADSAVVLIGQFVVSGFASFSGLVGGGAREEGVSGGFPAGSGVGQVADDEGGFLVRMLSGAD